MGIYQSIETCPLSARQIEAVQWLAHGKTAIEIGMIMGRPKFTVQKDILNARQILGLNKETALVAVALRAGWIQ